MLIGIIISLTLVFVIAIGLVLVVAIAPEFESKLGSDVCRKKCSDSEDFKLTFDIFRP